MGYKRSDALDSDIKRKEIEQLELISELSSIDVSNTYYDPIEKSYNNRRKEKEHLPRLKKRKQTVSYWRTGSTAFFHFTRLLRFLFIVQLLFLCVSLSIATSLLEWNNDVPYPIDVSNSIAFVGQDQCIYVFGGYNSSSDAVSNSYRFNTTAGSMREWSPIEPVPNGGVFVATGCVSNDGRFFIFGGLNMNSSTSNHIQIYNATNNSWNTISPNMTSGTSIADVWMSCALDSSSGLMYLSGGTNNGRRFYSYNVSSNTITNLSSSSSPTPFNAKGQGSFVSNNGKLYVFGGYNKDTGVYFSSTHIYDIANNIWSSSGNMTQAACCFGYATDGSRFYVIGGEYGSSIDIYYTQVFDISSGNWSVNDGSVNLKGITANVAVYLDGSLHSIGGYDGSYVSLHQIATLCGVYRFSGPCDDINQCIFDGNCDSKGQCEGTCISNSYCNCTSINNSTSTSNSNISSSITGGAIAGIVIALLVFLAIVSVAIIFLLKYKRKRQQEQIRSNSYDLKQFPLVDNYSEVLSSGVNSSDHSTPSKIVRKQKLFPVSTISANDNPYVLRIENIEVLKKIGEGAFGCVYLGMLNGTEVAIKLLSKSDASEMDIKEFLEEAELLRNLPMHPNVVLFRGVTVPPDQLSIVTDYCNGGSLSEYLKNHPNLPISEKIQFIKDIAKGMLHLHCGVPGKEVIHRDLAARNILLRNGVAVITDFGLSRVKASVDDYQRTETNVGPVKWMSPESLFERKYSTKSDVFSFGVVIYEILAQEPPWKDLTPIETSAKVRDGYRMMLPKNCDCPPALQELMERCWAQRPSERPDFAEIYKTLNMI